MPRKPVSPFGMTPEGRPIIYNPEEQGFSTEYTTTVQHPQLNNGQYTNIPSIFSGQFLQPDQALNIVLNAGGYDPETGRRLLGYSSLDAAIMAAKARTKELDAQVGQRINRLNQQYPNGPQEDMQFSGRQFGR